MGLYAYNGILLNQAEEFAGNASFSYSFDSVDDTNYTVFRIFKKKVDGQTQHPFLRYIQSRTTAYELAQSEGWPFVINSGIGEGLIIENATLITDTAASTQSGVLPLTIDSNGDLGYLPADTTGNGATYIANGVVSAVCGFFPIIVDYEDYDYPTDIPGTFDSAVWVNAQRQIIGQFGNGDYCVITGAGRGYDGSTGLTIPQAQTICKNLGLKFAYNLDGGGSTQTVIGGRLVNVPFEGTYGRARSCFIAFNGTNSYGIPNA